MSNKYINKKTYELLDNVFSVDEEIAETISLLNKKGYDTVSSCSGHIKEPVFYKRIYDIHEKINIDNVDSYIVEKNKNTITILSTVSINSIYIKFDNNYIFKTIPQGFQYDSESNVIEHIIKNYSNDKRVPSNLLNSEMIKYNKLLFDWTKTLPDNSSAKAIDLD